jgi:hypothetical protein
MNRLTLAATILTLLLFSTMTHAQSNARVNQIIDIPESNDAGVRAIIALKRLENDVIVYESLGAFENSGKLARVPLRTFEQKLVEVVNEVEPVLSLMPASRVKWQLTNALNSYRDGLFWWSQIDQPRVVHVSSLAASEAERSRFDAAFLSTIPYTVAIHWRQAQKYLNQAEKNIGR